MKYLNKLFAFEERQSHQHSFSATLTSTLYSVTFIPKSYQESNDSTSTANEPEQISIVAHGGRRSNLLKDSSVQFEATLVGSTTKGSLLTASTAKTKADSTKIKSSASKRLAELTTSASETTTTTIEDVDDDWIILDNTAPSYYQDNQHSKIGQKSVWQARLRQMALDQSDIELIKASWVPVKCDKEAAGVLLFKGLFTKFPEYMKLFSFKDDFDLERMRENKRLLSHAKKVIDTVSFVVDAIGDEGQTAALNEALLSLVKGHLKKKPPIGLAEFRNLGIVLIDFICDINNRRGAMTEAKSQDANHSSKLNSLSTGDSINNSSIDSETMTNALDKVRASTSPSSSEEESYLTSDNPVENQNSLTDGQKSDVYRHNVKQDRNVEPNINTNFLVVAWTKLYSIILDLVKHEEEEQSRE